MIPPKNPPCAAGTPPHSHPLRVVPAAHPSPPSDVLVRLAHLHAAWERCDDRSSPSRTAMVAVGDVLREAEALRRARVDVLARIAALHAVWVAEGLDAASAMEAIGNALGDPGESDSSSDDSSSDDSDEAFGRRMGWLP